MDVQVFGRMAQQKADAIGRPMREAGIRME